MSIQITTQSSCPQCGGQINDDPKHGERACTECGTILEEDVVDPGPEWRTFSDEDQKRVRVGTPSTQTMHDNGLSTEIGWQNRDANGRSLPQRKRTQLGRLRKWHKRCQTKGGQERNLKQALSEINRMASALGLPKSTRETASVIYRRALDENLVRGRSIEGIATGSLYAACRQDGVPRTLDEMEAVSRVEYDRIAREYRTVANSLDIAIDLANPIDYLPRFASELECSKETQRIAHDVLESVLGTTYQSGKSPVALAAAALYTASYLTNERIYQREISDVAGVSTMTIRTHYTELADRYES